MSKLVLTSTVGQKVKDKGGLKKDADGYYYIKFGVIGIPNTSGIVYELTKPVRELFSDNSPLMMRLKKGYLRAEQGHPKKTPGMTHQDYLQRILRIEEKSICGHIRELEVLENVDGIGTITIYGWIKPAGPYADALRDDLENPHSNTAFSIRSLADQRIENGVIIRTIKTIVTWDFVNMPGIEVANKTNTIGAEHDLMIIDTDNKEEMNEFITALESVEEFGMENDQMLAKEIAQELKECSEGECIFKDW